MSVNADYIAHLDKKRLSWLYWFGLLSQQSCLDFLPLFVIQHLVCQHNLAYGLPNQIEHLQSGQVTQHITGIQVDGAEIHRPF
jgi:hypothetical protein